MKIFISGVSKGLGLYLAGEYLRRKDSVWGIARSIPDKEALGPLLTKGLVYAQCDTTDKGQINLTFHNMLKSSFIPDIAIFCAGRAISDAQNDDFYTDKLKENFELNLYGILYWIELMLPYYLERKRGIFAGISSMSVYRENHRDRIGYSAAKAALNKSFENLRMQYLGRGLNFTIFNLGRIRERPGLIGISPEKACGIIARLLDRNGVPDNADMPGLQYILTRLSALCPKPLYRKYFFK